LNPFIPSTTTAFTLPAAGFVAVQGFNVLGQEIALLVNEQLVAGKSA
jgi:hypothetical protein